MDLKARTRRFSKRPQSLEAELPPHEPVVLPLETPEERRLSPLQVVIASARIYCLLPDGCHLCRIESLLGDVNTTSQQVEDGLSIAGSQLRKHGFCEAKTRVTG